MGAQTLLSMVISTHALREEGDPAHAHGMAEIDISTHALREEGDRTWTNWPTGSSNFYPRPPRGGRRLTVAASVAAW